MQGIFLFGTFGIAMILDDLGVVLALVGATGEQSRAVKATRVKRSVRPPLSSPIQAELCVTAYYP